MNDYKKQPLMVLRKLLIEETDFPSAKLTIEIKRDSETILVTLCDGKHPERGLQISVPICDIEEFENAGVELQTITRLNHRLCKNAGIVSMTPRNAIGRARGR